MLHILLTLKTVRGLPKQLLYQKVENVNEMYKLLGNDNLIETEEEKEWLNRFIYYSK